MSMMMSNLLSETSEFRLLQLRSISPGMSSGGLLSHKSRSIAFGNTAGGCLPGQLVKLQLSQVPLPLAITNVRHVRASCCRVPWYDMEHPMNWGMLMASWTRVYVIERFGKYSKTLTTPGIHFLIPFVDKVAYIHSRCRESIPIPKLCVITKDGYIIESIHGSLLVQVVDPILASYGVGNPITYMTQLARASIRSEVGKMTGHMVIEERDTLNEKILISISEDEGVKRWGLRCHRFIILGLLPLAAEMNKRTEFQERKRRAHLMAHLEHEGERQALNAFKLAAQGDAEAIIGGAQAIAEDITMVSKNLKAEGGVEVSSLRIAEDEAFDKIVLRVAVKVFAMIENLGLLTDAANRSVMKGETNQASLPQSKHDGLLTDAANRSAMKGETDQASLPQSKHDVVYPSAMAENLGLLTDEAFDKIVQRVAVKVFAMIENLGLLLTDAVNPSVMKGETNQASLPQSKQHDGLLTDAANRSAMKGETDQAYLPQSKHDAANPSAMAENLGLLIDVANPSAMKGETNQAALPQSKHDDWNPSAVLENLGLLRDAANPYAMKGETDQASLPQSKLDVVNPSAMKVQPNQASLPQSKHDVANPGSAEPSFFTQKQ